MLPYMSLLFEMNAARFRGFDGICGNLSESRQLALFYFTTYHISNIEAREYVCADVLIISIIAKSKVTHRPIFCAVLKAPVLISSCTFRRQCGSNVVPDRESFPNST